MPLQQQDGFTLVELMMATAITLIVLATATGTFKNALSVNDTATLIADSNQNLRSGGNLLVRDFMQAGRGIPTGGIPIPSGALVWSSRDGMAIHTPGNGESALRMCGRP